MGEYGSWKKTIICKKSQAQTLMLELQEQQLVYFLVDRLVLLFLDLEQHIIHKDGAAGDTARAMGDLALSARSIARQLDEKHHFVDKSKEVAHKAWEKAKEIDREHHVVDKSRCLIVNGFHFLIGVISQVMKKISENQQNNRTSQC